MLLNITELFKKNNLWHLLSVVWTVFFLIELGILNEFKLLNQLIFYSWKYSVGRKVAEKDIKKHS